MKLTITSIAGSILAVPSFIRLILMTEGGEITILPGHENLLGVVRPGILAVEYEEDGQKKSQEYVTGGGVLQITTEQVTILVDAIESEKDLQDLDSIQAQKDEAEKIMTSYKAENHKNADDTYLRELEYDFLKYTAMAELSKKIRVQHGRK